MINSQAGYIFKLLILSSGLSILIKYGAIQLSIEPTPGNALCAIATPLVVMVLALWWRGNKNKLSEEGSRDLLK